MHEIVTIGEALIDLAAIETGVPLSDVTSFKRVAGGAPANVAIGCSKLGRNAGFITRVGNEAFGKHIISVLEQYGVSTKGVQLDNEANTGLAFIGLPSPYTRDFMFYRNPSADMKINYNEIPAEMLTDTKIFHFGSISLINEPAAESTIRAVKQAKKSGAIISYDPNLRLSLWKDEETARRTIIQAMQYADIIKVNDDEMKFIYSDDNLEKGAQRMLEEGPGVVLCTMGEYGSLYTTKNFSAGKDIVRLDSLDSTGCGDSFLSGIFSILCDYSLDDIISNEYILQKAVGFGAAAAAITSTMTGVTEALPDKKSVEKLLDKLRNG